MISISLRALVAPMTAVLMIAVVHAGPTPQTQAAPTYKDPAAPVEARVADLLGRMTMEEKVAQLVTVWNQRSVIQDAQRRFTAAKALVLFGQGINESRASVAASQAMRHVPALSLALRA